MVVSSTWLRNALLLSLLMHAVVLVSVRGLHRDALSPETLITVELDRPPPQAITPPPKVVPMVPRPLTPPPPVVPTPVMTAPPEAAPRPEQPVIQRPPEQAPPPPIAPAPPAPAPAPTPPPVAAESAVDQNELRRGYIRGVSTAVAKQKRYPRIAMQRGWQGEVMLRVVVDSNGNLVDVAVQQGSGYEALDREAIEMVRRAAPFPLTAGMKREELAISLPVQFRLEAP